MTRNVADVTKQFIQDVMHEMYADQLVILIPNRKNHTTEQAKIDGAGLLFASMGAEPYLTTPTALKELPDDGNPNNIRENLAWVFDKNGQESQMAKDAELRKVVDGMFSERIRGFQDAKLTLEEREHYPHWGGSKFIPAIFKDVEDQLSKRITGAAQTKKVSAIASKNNAVPSR